MSIRNLDSLFQPARIAVIGASDRPASVGATVWRNLRAGGFQGPIDAVNPGRRVLDGVKVHPTVASLPEAPELAVICTPAATVPGLIAELGERGTRAAVVLTAGLDTAMRQAVLDAARPHLLRVLGPNCIGLLSPHVGLNASFAHRAALPGDIAFVSQSGALMTALLDWAHGRGIGFSHFISLGESLDVDFGDLLDWLASDPRTRSILLYVESIHAAQKFMSAARAAARNKPLILVKAGRSSQGQAAARSHTGAMSGSDAVFDAAIRRAGGLRVDTLQDLFLAAETLSRGRAEGAAPQGLRDSAAAAFTQELEAGGPEGRGLAILTNGGGAGVMAADAAAALDLPLARLSEATLAQMDAALPATWSRANPVDIIGDAPAARYVAAFEALLADPAVETLLFIQAPTAIVDSLTVAEAVLPLALRAGSRLVSCWLGDGANGAVAPASRAFRLAGVPVFETPEEAVRALAMRMNYRRHQALLMEAPAPRAAQAPTVSAETSEARARRVVARALAEGRDMLTEPEAKAVLAAAGVPVVATTELRFDTGLRAPGAPPPTSTGSGEDPGHDSTDDSSNPDDPARLDDLIARAGRAAEAIGWPVAAKLLSHDISHKSDVGGVALGLTDAAALDVALRAMHERVRRLRPQASIEGFTVQAMAQRGHAQELIVGASLDPVFGPVILFGQGGTAVEVVADRALALPPLNEPLARDLVDRTRVARLLAGYRDVPPADRAALHRTLVAVSDLLVTVPEIAELDINPLWLDERGALALDARIRVRADRPAGAAHFAIQPYPSEWVREIVWRGQAVTLRPIRPEDEAQHLAFLASLDPEDLRLRIFQTRRHIERSELARLTQIDYAREMAIVAVTRDESGTERTLGAARAVADPDNTRAEFGVIVRSDLKGSGLGEALMRLLIEVQTARGTGRLVGSVLDGNDRMLGLMRRLGFQVGPVDASEGIRTGVLVLQAEGN